MLSRADFFRVMSISQNMYYVPELMRIALFQKLQLVLHLWADLFSLGLMQNFLAVTRGAGHILPHI